MFSVLGLIDPWNHSGLVYIWEEDERFNYTYVPFSIKWSFLFFSIYYANKVSYLSAVRGLCSQLVEPFQCSG